MELQDISRSELLDYVTAQLTGLFPDRYAAEQHATLDSALDEALDRLSYCVRHVRMWHPESFNYRHSEQYCLFLYYLANTLWRRSENEQACTKLFALNKALNGFNCFYDTVLPDIMFIGHSVGIVLARVTYGNYLVLYQNSTVGKNHGREPVLDERVVLYPNSAIIGGCHARSGTVLAQGSSLIDCDSPGDCYVLSRGKTLKSKPASRDVFADFFRA